MKKTQLKVNAIKSVKNNLIIKSSIKLVDLPRLKIYSKTADSTLEYDIKFLNNGFKKDYIEVKLNTSLSIECHRCSENFTKEISLLSQLNIVKENANINYNEDEVEIDSENMVDLLDLIEDEVILEIGSFPTHPIDVCNVTTES